MGFSQNKNSKSIAHSKYGIWIASILFTLIFLLLILGYYSKKVSDECFLGKVIETNGRVFQINQYGRVKDVLFEYFIDNKRYVGSTALKYKLKENQLIKVVYCQNEPSDAMYYESYILYLKKRSSE